MLHFLLLCAIGEDHMAQIEDRQGNGNSSCSEDLDQGKIPRQYCQSPNLILKSVKHTIQPPYQQIQYHQQFWSNE